MDNRTLMRIKHIGDAANRAVLAHLNRAKDYPFLTVNEELAIGELHAELDRYKREAASPLSETAA